MVEAMLQGKVSPISFKEIIEVTEVTFAVQEAIRTGQLVSLGGEVLPRLLREKSSFYELEFSQDGKH